MLPSTTRSEAMPNFPNPPTDGFDGLMIGGVVIWMALIGVAIGYFVS